MLVEALAPEMGKPAANLVSTLLWPFSQLFCAGVFFEIDMYLDQHAEKGVGKRGIGQKGNQKTRKKRLPKSDRKREEGYQKVTENEKKVTKK